MVATCWLLCVVVFEVVGLDVLRAAMQRDDSGMTIVMYIAWRPGWGQSSVQVWDRS